MTPKKQKRKKKNIQKAKKKPADVKTLSDRLFSFPIAHLIIIALVFVLYFQTFNFELGRLDEDKIILNNAKYLSDFGNITDSFFRDALYGIKSVDFYRPLQNISYFLDFALSGTKAWGYSLISILFHILTCITIFELMKAIKVRDRLALMVTLLYTAAPLFVQAIAWAPGRGDLLIGLFGSLSLLMLIKYFQSGKFLFLVLNLLSFVLAILSKEAGVILSLFYLIVWGLNFRQLKHKYNFLFFYSLHLFSVIFYLILRNQFVMAAISLNNFRFGSLFGNLATIPEYISKLILPNNLCPMPAYSSTTTIIGLLLMVVLIIIIIIYKLYKDKNVLIAASLFLTSIIPGMFYTHQYGKYAYSYLEHRAYLPSIGIILLIALILNTDKLKRYSMQIKVFILIFILAFSIYTIFYQKNYKDTFNFYSYTIEKNPQSAMALNSLGMYYGQLNHLDSALKYLNKSIAVDSSYPNPYNNRGIVECLTGNFKTALVDFNHALIINSAFVDAYYNRGNARNALGDKAGACSDWQMAYRLGSQGAFQALNKFCK